MAEAGIRPSIKHRRVGDYQLESLITDGVNYQDWLAKHVSVETRRRVRIYSYGKATSPDSRQALARQARREFQILEGVESPGILKVLDYKESELGPALVFEHDPKAERLDQYLQRKRGELDIGRRLYLLRELAETLRYAHKKRLYHRALSPASVLVRETSRAQSSASRSHHELADRRARSERHRQHGPHDRHATCRRVRRRSGPRVSRARGPARALAVAGPSLDVFALGAVAHLVLAGAPARDRSDRACRETSPRPRPASFRRARRRGRRLAGLGPLQHPSGSFRTNRLDRRVHRVPRPCRDELTAPEPERVADPSTAKPGDRIGAGFTVVK